MLHFEAMWCLFYGQNKFTVSKSVLTLCCVKTQNSVYKYKRSLFTHFQVLHTDVGNNILNQYLFHVLLPTNIVKYINLHENI